MRRKSEARKALEGTSRRDRARKGKRQPRPQGAVPAPSWLGDDARAVWEEIGPTLVRLGTLTMLDIAQFSRYCIARAHYEALARWCASHELSYATPSGQRKPVPEVALMFKYGDVVHRLAARFGLDPASRAALDILPGNVGASTEPEDQDPTDRDGVVDLVERRLRRGQK